MNLLQVLFRKKNIGDDDTTEHHKMAKCLTAFDLTLLGIGAIIGAGIFVLTGVAAATKAGPAIILSYVLSGFVCALTAMAYAELSSAIGGCGSAYGYAYAGLGELIAWAIGWYLLLEYGVACATVSIGWSGYVCDMLSVIGIHIPKILQLAPVDGGIMNLPAMFLVALITVLLCVGVKESTRFNNAIVFIKLITIVIFIAVATRHFNIQNWHPFMPFGVHGIVGGAALVFFAYIGFDAVSTAAEEAINPQRDMPRGIILSLLICTLVYIIVAGLLTGIRHYELLNNAAPVSQSLLALGDHVAAGIISAGAIAGLTTVVLVMFYGLTRVILAICRDGLLPNALSKLNPTTRTPMRVILICGVVIALIAGFVNIGTVAALVNLGTLAAFLVVCLGVVSLRKSQPDLPRPFKMPLSPWLPLLAAAICFYLMLSLSKITWLSFFIWTTLGLLIYFLFGIRKSKLAK